MVDWRRKIDGAKWCHSPFRDDRRLEVPVMETRASGGDKVLERVLGGRRRHLRGALCLKRSGSIE